MFINLTIYSGSNIAANVTVNMDVRSMYTYAKSHEKKNNQSISLVCKAKEHESMNIYLLLNKSPAKVLPQFPKSVGIWIPITRVFYVSSNIFKQKSQRINLHCYIEIPISSLFYIATWESQSHLCFTLLHGNPNLIFVLN